ncbi:MAG: guanylate kinase [Candidatus Aminicenantes bacterium]|nr:guanylate kinase [Candidatus Aminicenantes bacterium]
MLFIITGPSGCGKSTLVRHVMEQVKSLEFAVSHTTRIKRDGEQEAKDYYFVKEKEFKQMIDEDMFGEWAVVHGHYYGTSKREIEKKSTMKDLILDIDVQGATQIKEKHKKAVFIFVLPPGFQALKKRLQQRGQDSPRAIRDRLDMAKKEIRHYPMFDYIIINDDLDMAVEELKSVIISKRCLLDIRQKEIVRILQSFSEEG